MVCSRNISFVPVLTSVKLRNLTYLVVGLEEAVLT